MTMSKSKWVIDPAHTLVEFAVKHMMIATAKGRFSGVEGSIEADPADLSSAKFEATIDVNTVDTRDAQRDGHLRSADFFEVEKYPVITFRSRQVNHVEGNEYQLVGDLTIRGVSQPVTLDLTYEGQAKDPWGNERIGFAAQAKINRKDFGLTWNAALETGGFLVGEQVKLDIHIEAIKQG